MKRLAPSAAAFSTVLLIAGAPALAAGDMLQPNEIQYDGISANPSNDSGMFVGAGLAVGQSRTTEDGASPGLGFLASFEPGYQINTGSWSRVELSGQLLMGRVGFRDDLIGGKVSMPINFGLLLKAGKGYSLGNKLFGIVRAGVGPVQAKWDGDDVMKSGVGGESSSAMSGFAAVLAWDAVAPIGSSLDFVGGISWMHMQFDLGKVKGDNGVTTKLDRPVLVNMPTAQLGLRARL